MNDKPNPSPGPTVEEMLIALFRLLVVVAIAVVTTAALLIMAAYGTPQPSGSAHVDQLLYRGQLHTAANGPLFRPPPVAVEISPTGKNAITAAHPTARDPIASMR